MQHQYRLSANQALKQYLAGLGEAERAAAIGVLDLVCEPLTASQMERALLPFYTRKKTRELVKALKFIDVVALKPTSPTPTKPGWNE